MDRQTAHSPQLSVSPTQRESTTLTHNYFSVPVRGHSWKVCLCVWHRLECARVGQGQREDPCWSSVSRGHRLSDTNLSETRHGPDCVSVDGICSTTHPCTHTSGRIWFTVLFGTEPNHSCFCRVPSDGESCYGSFNSRACVARTK